jgi:hypothetical protein
MGGTHRAIPRHEPNLRQGKLKANILGRLRISHVGLVIPAIGMSGKD